MKLNGINFQNCYFEDHNLKLFPFDNSEYECRKPIDWISDKGLEAKAVDFDCNNKGSYKNCLVHEYVDENEEFKITFEHNNSTK